ncbi:hypothetical protein [Erythrobacter sp.]|uniref:hypothetical protein n=1 Tax=Erythrobacter sp. TaxID=1042 RepID=UPI001425F83C|nr:hypothetical protein [Erythrobacter sp.]QIQ85974.1 MAG: hypothetical protein G9473_04215 [Erythrobacter sp.]
MKQLRTFLSLLAALALSGCWLSTDPLFGPADNAAVDLEGPYRYTVYRGEMAEIESMVFEPQPDGSVRQTVTYAKDEAVAALIEEPLVAVSTLNFVAIPQAPEGWHLLHGSGEDGEREKLYMIASLDEERILRIYAPDCRGTPARTGLEISADPASGVTICNFTSKPALLAAAREAAELLARPSIVAIGPWAELSPVYEWESAIEDAISE